MPTVLIVDDNEANRDMLSRRLVKKGYEVAIADDAETGLSIARQKSPGVILMDMTLPVMTGWEATRVLKADPATRHIPVIALTAHAMATDRERALEAGCDDFETKPIEFTQLITKMQALLTRAAGA